MSQDSFDRFDDMAERTIWPWVDDEGQEWDVEDSNYDDHDDFFLLDKPISYGMLSLSPRENRNESVS